MTYICSIFPLATITSQEGLYLTPQLIILAASVRSKNQHSLHTHSVFPKPTIGSKPVFCLVDCSKLTSWRGVCSCRLNDIACSLQYSRVQSLLLQVARVKARTPSLLIFGILPFILARCLTQTLLHGLHFSWRSAAQWIARQ